MITYVKVDYYNKELAKGVIEHIWQMSSKDFNESFFLNPNNYLFVALDEQKIVGAIYGYTLERFHKREKTVFLYSVDVIESYRRQGIGKNLIQVFLNPFKFGKHDKAFVLTHQNNQNAMILYQKSHAKPVISPDGDCVLLAWKLT